MGVLGLAPGCSEEQLRAAYKRKVLETHPDKGGSVDSFRKVQTAYEALVKDLPKLNAAASFTPASFTPPKTSFPFARTFDDIFANFAHPPAPDPAPMAAKEFGRKRRRTMEETIEMAFASIPKVMRPPNLARSAPSSARSSVPAPKPRPKAKAKTVGEQLGMKRRLGVKTPLLSLRQWNLQQKNRWGASSRLAFGCHETLC
ncbi:unnamed protein product [Effrenium voratum]|nr:unnamed protein product [Effrenium voratum]